ncbi:MAG TPA: protein-disulfide reductase DsbD [Ignavibacteria bacterium]|nr:protein-disulfide reductase DsbD [Ignavibacteria bacterium]
MKLTSVKLLFYFLFSPILLFAQNSEYVNTEAFLNKAVYSTNDTVSMALKMVIKEKYHINSYQVADPTLIKTAISSGSNEFKLIGTYFPPDKEYKFEFSDNKIKVYEGTVYIGLKFTGSDLKPGSYEIPIKINYQACDDKQCYAPKTINFNVPVKIEATSSATLSNADVFKNVDFTKPTVASGNTNQTQQTQLTENERTGNAPAEEDQISDLIEEQGMFVALFFIFGFGLLLNLTPCVYPLIPVTISYFGAQSSGSKAQSILMGLFYALGMSITYTALGVFAALTGGLLGTALQSPIVIIGIAVVFIALGTSMFGLFEIRVPQKLALAGNKNRSGLFGSLIMGLLVGFIAAPCIGPIVLSLLLYVGKTGSPFIGFLLFFVLSMGLGFPYIFLAAFSSALNKLPRSGEWMIGVKIIFGLILFGMAINTMSPIIPKDIYAWLYPGYIIAAGAYLILIDRNGLSSKVYTNIKYIIAIVAIIWGTWQLKPAGATEHLNWQVLNSYSAIESSIQTEQKPVMIDFYADWCAQCKELDEYTYTDKEVIDLSNSFNNIKIDLTTENPEITEKFGIKGLPVVIFMNSKGEELRDLRITGFLKPEEFIKKMNSALERNK